MEERRPTRFEPRSDLLERRSEQRLRGRRRRRNLAIITLTALVVVVGAAAFGRGEADPTGAAKIASGAQPARALDPLPHALHVIDTFQHGDEPTRSGMTALLAHPGGWKRHPGGQVESVGGTLIATGSPKWTDVSIAASVVASGTMKAGVAARVSLSGARRYQLMVDAPSSRLRLERAEGDHVITLADAKLEPAPRYELTLDVRGGELVGSANDVAVSARDEAFATGRVGLISTHARGARFSNARIDASVDSVTLAVLPDTQFYVPHRTAASSTFTAQTRWLAQHRADRHIPFVLHEGDIVNDACSAPQWKVASFAMSRLDGKLPYALAPGNNDVLADRGSGGCAGADGYNVPAIGASFQPFNRTSPGPNNFGPKRQRAASPATWGGSMSPTDASASYHRFDAGGVRFLVITLPWGPTDAQLAWALRVARADPDRVGLLVTHDYLGLQGTLRGSGTDTYELPDLPGENDGRAIWSKLVHPAPNIRFVFNGHVTCRVVTAPDYTRDGAAARRVTKNAAGRPVYQMLANYQSMAGGGEGYLRLLTFTPAKGTVSVETVSVDPTAPKRREPSNRFTFTGVELG